MPKIVCLARVMQRRDEIYDNKMCNEKKQCYVEECLC